MPNILPVHIDAAKRRQVVLEYRSLGLTYQEIYDAMVARFGNNLPTSYDPRYAWRDFQDEMERLKKETMETAQSLRILELNRLDQLQSAIMPDALSGNLKAVDRVLKIMAHRANLVGLNAPARIDVKDWRSEIVELIKTGKITLKQAEEELGPELYSKLLESGGTDIIEGQFVEAEGRGTKDILPSDSSGEVART